MPSTPVKTTEIQPRKSIFRQAALQSLLVTIATALALSLCAFLVARALLQNRVFAQLSSLIVAKEERIESRLQTDRERTSLLGTRSELRDLLSGASSTSEIQEIFDAMQKEGVPITGLTIAARNTVVVSLGEAITLPKEQVTMTTITPVLDQAGWAGHSVFAPIIQEKTNAVIGTVAATYSARSLLDSVLDVASLGQTAEVLIGLEQNGMVTLLNQQFDYNERTILTLNSVGEELQYGSPVAKALMGESSIGRAEDHAGNSVFSAYTPLSTFDWALVVKINTGEALRGVKILGIALTAISMVLLVLAAVLARVLARHLTGPILYLSKRVADLGPGNWQITRSLQSGDEVEYLERKVVDMASRLKKIYDNLEDEVQSRTQELRQQYLKDRIILETIDYGVILVDNKGNVTEANPAALKVLQCTGDACLSRSVVDVLEMYANHKRLTSAHPVLLSLKSRKPIHSLPDIRYSVMRSDRILIPVALTVQPIIQGKELRGAIVVFQDVTEERRVDYMKSEFISLASHQLRTPLSTLEWYVELLSEEANLSSDQQEYIKEMNIATKRMVNLIDALLHAAKLEGRTIEPHTQELNISQLFEDLAEELQSLAKDKSIATKIDIPPEPILFTTDSVLLHVVFKNLFSNAVKYTNPKGTVGIRMRKEGSTLVISVYDNGVGIPEKEKPRIFERLFRAENVRKMDTDGNGLGLYISRMIVENLGGKISFTSTEGKGSEFTVVLRLKAPKSNTKK